MFIAVLWNFLEKADCAWGLRKVLDKDTGDREDEEMLEVVEDRFGLLGVRERHVYIVRVAVLGPAADTCLASMAEDALADRSIMLLFL